MTPRPIQMSAEPESDSDDSGDDSTVTVITKCISVANVLPVVSPVATPTTDLYSFDEPDAIKEVLDFEDGSIMMTGRSLCLTNPR